MHTYRTLLPVSALPSALLVLLFFAAGCAGDDGDTTAAGDTVTDAGLIGDGDDTGSDDTLASDAPTCSVAKDCPGFDEPCVDVACVDKTCTGKVRADGAACDDGDACTDPDTCKAAKCVAGAKCECSVDADCSIRENGNLCDGTLVCDKTAGKCVLDASTVVKCDSSKDSTCAVAGCDPKTGQCSQVSVAAGKSCDDGDTCTVGDACKDGACVPGASQCACKADSDCGKAGANPCDGAYYCDKNTDKWACKLNPGTVVTCPTDDDSACVKSQCDPATVKCGLKPVNDGAECDWDGNKCTVDKCAKGACIQGDLAGGKGCDCKVNADCNQYEDANQCNGSLFCNKANNSCQLNPATLVSCPSGDDTECRANMCNAKTGTCAYDQVANGTACSDGKPCSSQEACKNGLCEAVALTCDCSSTADCADKDDKDNCNGSLYCDKTQSKCVTNPATILHCPKPEQLACVGPECEPATGKCIDKLLEDGTKCEADGTACTGIDTCKDGKCLIGAVHCACQSDGDCAAFEDDNLCNGTLFCDKAKNACLLNPVTVIKCTGGDTCKPQTCTPKTGKCDVQDAPDGNACDADGFVCTKDSCDKGACKAGPNDCLCGDTSDCKSFEDGDFCNGLLRCDTKLSVPVCNVDPPTVVTCAAPLPGACTVQTCNPNDGKCVTGPGNQGKDCDDDELCTLKDACALGKCVGLAAPATQPCSDGNACTTPDNCSGGACKSGPKADCDDKIACTVDACDIASGCTITANDKLCDDNNACSDDSCNPKVGCHHDTIAGKCEDATVCNGIETCDPKTGCVAGKPLNCDDANVCTNDSCDKTKGCTAVNNQDPCTDGVACTLNDLCDGAGACKAGSDALWTQAFNSGTVGGLHAVEPRAGGGWILAGYTSGGTSENLYAVAIDGNRKQVGQFALASGGDASINGMARYAGKIAIVGHLTIGGKDGRFIGLLNDNAQLALSEAVTPAGSEGFDAVADVNGDAVAVGFSAPAQSPKIKGLMVRHDGALKELKAATYGGNYGAALHGVAALGPLWVATGEIGQDEGGLADSGRMWTLIGDKNGTIIAERSENGEGTGVGYAIATTGTGNIVAAGKFPGLNQGDRDGIVVLYDTRLQRLAKVTLALGKGSDAGFETLAVDDQHVLTLGPGVDPTTKQTGRVAALWDHALNPIGGPSLVSFGATTPVASMTGAVADKGGFVLAGSATVGGKKTAMARLIDPFMNGSCAASGACYALVGKCDDGKPCTTDTCDAKAGCAFTAIPDQANCDDGSPCTRSAKCASGKCEGQEILGAVQLTGPTLATDVARHDDGTIVVAGYVDGTTTTAAFATLKADGSGQTTSQTDNKTAKGRAWGIASFGDDAVLVGEGAVEGTVDGIVWYGKDGLLRPEFEIFGDNEVLRLVAVDADRSAKTFMAVGHELEGNQKQYDTYVMMGKLTNGRLAKTDKYVFSNDGNDSANGIKLLPGGAALIVGTRGVGAGTTGAPWIARLGGDGKPDWQRTYSAAKEGEFTSLTHIAGNRFALGGYIGWNGNDQKELLVFADSAAGTFAALPDLKPAAKAHTISALTFDSAGRIVTVGIRGDDVESTAVAAALQFNVFEAGGAVIVEKSASDGTKRLKGVAVAELIDGSGYAVVQNVFAAGKSTAWLRIVGRHGDMSCTAAGACFAASVASCDDGKPCTADTCAAGKCVSTARPENTPCTDGNLCQVTACSKAVCQAVFVAGDCDDKNVCTTDSCDNQSGCKTVATAGTCDDGTACTVDDTCKDGRCEGAPGFWEYSEPAGGLAISYTTNGVAVAADGRAFAVGQISKGGGDETLSWGLQVGADGKRSWYTEHKNSFAAELTAAVVAHDGQWLGVGWGGGEIARGMLVWFDAAGKVTKDVDITGVAQGLGHTNFYAVVKLAAGGYGLVGSVGGQSSGALAMVVDNAGTKVWSKTDSAGSFPNFTGVATNAAADIVAIGWFKNEQGQGERNERFVRYDKTGKVASAKSHANGFSDLTPMSIIAHPQGGWLVSGRSSTQGSDNPYVAALNNDGGVIYRTLTGATQASPMVGATRAAASVGAGQLAVVGVETVGQKPETGYFAITNALGARETYRPLGSSSGSSISAIVAVTGGYIVAGLDDVGGQKSGRITIRRIGAFGDVSCSEAGECVDKSPTICADSDPCTSNTCEPAKGCVVGVHAVNTPCDANNKVCTAAQKCETKI